ncbi:MAG: BLUF domain-containing protein [Alphaproteobacteria bacterium]|nr:MAG: BLUF domain-containing protein [Alphaproteobacteria bacterium]
MLFRLIYASRAKASAATDLPEILEWSRAHNPDLSVTGTLCLLDGTYIEHLEGEELVLKVLFENIRHDPRHQQVTVLDQRLILRRAYPEWSLALKVWDDRTKAIFRSISPGQNLDAYASDPSTAAPFVRALTRPENWNFSV